MSAFGTSSARGIDPVQAPVRAIRAQAYRIPTDAPEADGTYSWDATTLIVVELDAHGLTGLGYTYSDASIVGLIQTTLAKCVLDQPAGQISAVRQRMQREVRNLGRSGLAASALSAIDCALWDLKARLLGLPLVTLLGAIRDAVPIYGSGGFTTYEDARLRHQLSGWVERDGCRWVKIKVGSEPERDPHRVQVARDAIGAAGLFVDANGALAPQAALAFAQQCARYGISWFEEPVSSDDPDGLRLVREGVPNGIEIAAGEYGFTLDDFRSLISGKAVDVLQADVTRCGGISGFLQAADLCDAFHVPLSAHCAPAQHLHVACAAPRLRHQEWFHDHVRIESMLFDGAPVPRDGVIQPDLARAGCGLAFKFSDAAPYRVA